MIIPKATADRDTINIRELNYDCIEHICSFLEIADLVSLATACPPVFFEHCVDCLENEVLTSDIINDIASRMDRTYFFSTYGRMIRRLCITPFVADYVDWLRLLETYCPNVKSMRFCRPKLHVTTETAENEEVAEPPCSASTINELIEAPIAEGRIETINLKQEYLLNRYWHRHGRLAVLKLAGPVLFRGPIRELVVMLKMDGDLRGLKWIAKWLTENNIEIVVVEGEVEELEKLSTNDQLAVVGMSGATKRRLALYNPIDQIKKKCSRVLTVILQRRE